VVLATLGYKFFMKIFIYLFFIITVVSFTQCKSGRAISKAIAPRDTTKIVQIKSFVDSLLLLNTTKTNLQKNKIDFKTFSAKIKLDIETSKGKKPDLVANVRIMKDSAIWISISASFLNVEVFRALITKDSVILVDKQEREVHYRSIDYLQEITDIPFNYFTMQDLLIGNPIFFNEDNMTVRKFDNFLLVSSVSATFKNLITVSTPDNLLQHCKLDDIDLTQNRTADFTFDSYSNINGFPFSTFREIVATEKNKLDIRMNFKQYEFNKELSVSFNIPKNYKKN
jgi:Domain of unknown function (DUF4292)